ncbi:TetR/AcrR family transcriptional regulator [Salipaludibacillus sp. LMS25]|jgi:AcrR family transcriptional regulator|uniref:TetR/AcrR family transcriptional regulator n=1 Tax=Salipaludibacillus sp. LMS25 TaxID=2924031 RepID=UPI0020D0EA34|nr:TetR/AcrR family transcriptional regulator [Salipaludibacillus sp. LMS25]UTR14000.1 TetR/AcrR family transcriptional regulator [Salipaludibacillus sp. LMS25]
MPKTDGALTKERILQVAEKLFSQNGFDGTSVDKIAKETGINKGSIYYHFKDKNDIIESLFQNIIQDVEEHLNIVNREKMPDGQLKIEDKIKAEIDYLHCKKSMLSILLMEAMKSGASSDHLFKCAEVIISNEHTNNADLRDEKELTKEELEGVFVHEFFTGIIPILSFITLKDKWSNYFNIDEDKLTDYFMEAFKKTHLK